MPVTKFQARIAKLISVNRSPKSYLAGGAAMHFEPQTLRFSQDLDYFHDSEIIVAEAFSADSELLQKEGFEIKIEMRQPGYIRAIVKQKKDATKIEWAHDSAWRFMPTLFLEDRGYTLHPIDLAVNKVLALAGRDEPRDYLDVLDAHSKTLPLAAMLWAACGKDPGFSPNSLFALLQRKGKYREEDFSRLMLNQPVDLKSMKSTWLSALSETEAAIGWLKVDDVGCLYYCRNKDQFVLPSQNQSLPLSRHFATKGGVLPNIVN